ncbi:MAG: hypothetical protein MUF49_05925 [Oculatellaceae cyanobacterium Prado106]|jgi:hypothetical protein|nr:hypothetical protein [Oculatellaceae cyanobacterium Prado106]
MRSTVPNLVSLLLTAIALLSWFGLFLFFEALFVFSIFPITSIIALLGGILIVALGLTTKSSQTSCAIVLACFGVAIAWFYFGALTPTQPYRLFFHEIQNGMTRAEVMQHFDRHKNFPYTVP